MSIKIKHEGYSMGNDDLQIDSGTGVIDGLKSDIKSATALLNKFGLIPGKSMLHSNFAAYGNQFGALSVNDFENMAVMLLNRAKQQAKNPDYSIVNFPDGRIGADFRGEVRGIYSSKGKPLAFFKPDYSQLGYSSRERELDAWRKGKSLFYA